MTLLSNISLAFNLFLVGFIAIENIPESSSSKTANMLVVDTVIVHDTILDVKGKNVLFIGDSHTSNTTSGWQLILSNKTKMRMNNISVGGKTTGWMLQRAKESLHSGIDYCFIYGGANDMYSSSISITTAVKNIQMIVNLCNQKGIHAVVITGFNPLICVNTPSNSFYASKYRKFQDELLNNIKGANVIQTYVVSKTDCWDGLCHMAPSGHKKMADCIIKNMKFKTY